MIQFKNYSIKTKLVVFTMTATILALGLVILAMNIIDNYMTRKAIIEDLKTISTQIASRSGASLAFRHKPNAQSNVNAFAENKDFTMACIYLESAQPPKGLEVFVDYTLENYDAKCPQDPETFVKNRGDITDEYIHAVTSIEVPMSRGVLYLRKSLNSINQRFQQFALASVGISLVMLFVIYILISRLQKIISKPIVDLSALSDKVAKDNNYSLRAHIEGEDELGSLGNAFNAMLEAIDTAQERLKDMAFNDALTGLPNRRYFMDTLAKEISAVGRGQKTLTLFLIDLDGFKGVNDTIGHDAGDWVLTTVSDRMKYLLRKTDMVARLGGDEFTIILNSLSEPMTLRRIALNVIRCIEEPIDFKGQPANVSASVGIAIAPTDAIDMDTLLKCADSAMYNAKEKGKKTFYFYNQVNDQKTKSFNEVENKLLEINSVNDIEILFEPIFDIETKEIFALTCEAITKDGLAIDQHTLQSIASPQLAIRLTQTIIERLKTLDFANNTTTQIHMYLPNIFLNQQHSEVDIIHMNHWLAETNTNFVPLVDYSWAAYHQLNNKNFSWSFIPCDDGNGLDLISYFDNSKLSIQKTQESPSEEPTEKPAFNYAFVTFPETIENWSQSAWEHLIKLSAIQNLSLVATNINTKEQYQMAKELGLKHLAGESVCLRVKESDFKDSKKIICS